ncbi:MAG: DUF1127 domain-containing protein [Candidatus Competibacterales bacterium]
MNNVNTQHGLSNAVLSIVRVNSSSFSHVFANAAYAVVRSAGDAVGYLGHVIAQWNHNYKTRNELAMLPDNLISDIGLEPHAVRKEVHRWFWQSIDLKRH